MRDLLSDLDIEVMSAEEAGVLEDVEEDQDTFTGNSLKKARFVAEKTGQWAVADDSGLCIDALDGAPGVYSARWANGADLVEYTLDKMKDKENRQAYFESAVALVSPTGEERVFAGRVDGFLSNEPRGVDRPKLPYDRIFIPEEYDLTFAEMSDEQKNSLSHRGHAFSQLKEYLCQELKLRN